MAESLIRDNIVTSIFSLPAFRIHSTMPGQFITNFYIDVSKSGYQPIAATFNHMNHGGDYHPVILLNGNTAEIALYATYAIDSDFSANDIAIDVVYRKI